MSNCVIVFMCSDGFSFTDGGSVCPYFGGDDMRCSHMKHYAGETYDETYQCTSDEAKKSIINELVNSYK